MVRRALCQDRMTPRLRVLNVLFHKSNTQHLATLVGASANDRRYSSMEQWIKLFKDWRFGDSRFGFITTDIQVLFEVFDGWSTLFDSWLEVSVHSQYVF